MEQCLFATLTFERSQEFLYLVASSQHKDIEFSSFASSGCELVPVDSNNIIANNMNMLFCEGFKIVLRDGDTFATRWVVGDHLGDQILSSLLLESSAHLELHHLLEDR